MQVEARQLQELLPASKLRAAGWRLPQAVDDDYLLRVYDTLFEPHWLNELDMEVCGGHQLPLFTVDGDFLTQPHLEDQVALGVKEP